MDQWGRPPGLRPTPPSAFVDRRKKPTRGSAHKTAAARFAANFEGVSTRHARVLTPQNWLGISIYRFNPAFQFTTKVSGDDSSSSTELITRKR
jgi:hypothetical protein